VGGGKNSEIWSPSSAFVPVLITTSKHQQKFKITCKITKISETTLLNLNPKLNATAITELI
jgi:hypothetical protein